MTDKEAIARLEEEVSRLTSIIKGYKPQVTAVQYGYIPNIPLPKPIEFEGDIKANINFF